MIKRFFSRLILEEDGAAASEYAILVAIVAVVVFAAVKLFDLNVIFQTVNNKVSGCVNAASSATSC